MMEQENRLGLAGALEPGGQIALARRAFVPSDRDPFLLKKSLQKVSRHGDIPGGLVVLRRRYCYKVPTASLSGTFQST
ncbi:MAG: hypothetical protein KC643_27970, partial [Nitrospira sp.]|nr:hypothetical protein [Nitrospira sp.]